MPNAQDFFPGLEHFAESGQLLGTQRISVAIGGLSVHFEGVEESLLPQALEKYGPFLWDGPVLHAVTLHSGSPSYLLPERYMPFKQGSYREGEVLASTQFAAFRYAKKGRGVLRVSDPTNAQAVLGAMENYLRWVIADLALHRDGFVLHSAGVVVDGSAYLFFGHSGRGKSTVASFSEGSLLSDDLVLLQKRDGKWIAATTPFAGTLPQSAKKAGNYPIAGLYLLRKSSSLELDEISAAYAAGALVSCCPFVSEGARHRYLFPLVEDLVDHVPVYELHFRKDPSFWDLIISKRQADLRKEQGSSV